MDSWGVLISVYLLKFARFLIDTFSGFFFWLLNLRKGEEKIEPVCNPILLQPAYSLADQIRKGKVKSVDVIEAYISRIKEVQPLLNVVADNRFEEALEDARKADELIKSQKYTEEELERTYPYLGVPFTNKEPIAVKGMLNTAGTFKNKGYRAAEDADTVALMRKVGAIPLAVTNVPEMCMWSETNNYAYGRSNNPYDTKRIVGGSCGGEGALISAGGSVIGIGSDLAGSIRIPSFYNGIFGHKPSKGIVSNRTQLPNFGDQSDEFWSTGPMCRYAKDLLPMFKVLAGNNDSKLTLDETVNISELKVYYQEESGDASCTPVSSEMKKALRKTVKHFQEVYGIKPRKVNFKEMKDAFYIWFYNMATLPSPSFSTNIVKEGESLNEAVEIFKWIFRCSKYTLPCMMYSILDRMMKISSTETRKSYVAIADGLRKKMEELLGDDGIFLYPSFPEPAGYHNQMLFKLTDVGYTDVFNILGLPVTQCPLGLSSNGLPLGVQVVGGFRRDHLTLAAAVELEKAFGGWRNPNSSN